jgi:hypothetical protein
LRVSLAVIAGEVTANGGALFLKSDDFNKDRDFFIRHIMDVMAPSAALSPQPLIFSFAAVECGQMSLNRPSPIIKRKSILSCHRS